MAKTSKPSGLTITRNANKFVFSWKRNNSPTAQQFQWSRLLNDKWTSWSSSSIGSGTTSVTKEFTWNKYYPYTSSFMSGVKFRVRGKKSGKWSAWVEKSVVIDVPNKPSLTAALSTEVTNSCKFSWETITNTDDFRPFSNVEWQSILQEGYNASEIKSIANWSDLNGYQSGIGAATDSQDIDEVTTDIADGSHTRWFRVRSRGPREASEWVYEKHVYAQPYQAVITSFDVSDTNAGGYLMHVEWNVNEGNDAFPIDNVTVQYAMVVPDEDLAFPSEANWTDANISVDAGETGAATVVIDTTLAKDQCLFVRVNTKHDTVTTPGIPTLVKLGELKAPTGLSVTKNDSTHIAVVSATNNSDVPDSFLAVKYCPASNPEGLVLGIITNGSANVQCPDWSGETAVAFEVYAVQGDYTTASMGGVTEYRINANMTSETVFNGGAIPIAPANVSLNATDISGTIQVRWDWSWAQANGAEISWADHIDAWESTDQPQTFEVSNQNASKLNISGLETGITWYVRVRLFDRNGENTTYGAYSDTLTIDLSSAPTTPVLKLSAGVIPADGMVTATWAYVSGDGTSQQYAEICEATYENNVLTYGEVIASTKTAQHIDLYAEKLWNAGEVHYLCVRVQSGSGKMSDSWSDPVPIIIADPMSCSITETSLVSEHIETNPRTFSGNPISFETEIEEQFAELEVALEATQSGSGTPSPSNVRPIYGVGGVTVDVVGKNLVDKDNITWTNAIRGDDGTPTASTSSHYTNAIYGVKANAEYTISGTLNTSTSSYRLYFLKKDGTFISRTSTHSGTPYTFTTPNECEAIQIQVAVTSTITLDDVQLEQGSTATTYEPYTETTVSQDFNVSLTPTSKDTDPYLFKAVGDIYGDRLEEDLVGAAVNWNQTIQFGTFETTSNGVTFSWNANGTITVNGTATGIAYANIGELLTGKQNHVFLYRGCPNGGSISTYSFKDGYLSPRDYGNGVVIKNTDPSGRSVGQIYIASGTVCNNLVFEPQRIDLTAMFGATIADAIHNMEQAQAGSGIALLKASGFFNKYIPYDSGTLKSVNPTAHITRGVNAWDEEWELGTYNVSTGEPTASSTQIRSKNYIPILPNTSYYATGVPNEGMRPLYYDDDKNFISAGNLQGGTYNNPQVTPNNARYMRFYLASSYGTTYKNDICINISDPTINGKYYPYEEHTYDLGNVELRGIPKLVNGKLTYDGDVRKYDGTVTRKYGIVDLGTLTYTMPSSGQFTFALSVIGAKAPTDATLIPNAVCSKYIPTFTSDADNLNGKFKFHSGNGYAYIYDSSYSDATAFKTAMSGVMLCYEKATPTTETTTPFTQIQEVSKYGTLEYITTNGIPVGHNTTYMTRDIFGGTLDLVSGRLVVTHGYKYFDGSEDWKASSNANRFYVDCLPTDFPFKWATDVTAISNMYDWWAASSSSSYLPDKKFMFYYASSYAYREIVVHDTSFSTVAQWKAHLAANNLFVMYELNEPLTYQLTPQQINTLVGTNNVWGNGSLNVRIAESIRDANVLTQLPLIITADGAGDAGNMVVTIKRAEDYFLERPDESEFIGYVGETTAIMQRSGNGSVEITLDDLLGMLDDGATYNLNVTVYDELGQSASDELDFIVDWEHQALIPTAEIELQDDVMLITPVQPSGIVTGDTCDIYRLSVDRPQLILQGCEWGTEYVDPYPTIGDFGGYRVVFKSLYGDYITEDNILAWTDYGKEEGVYYYTPETIIDFGSEQVRLMLDMSMTSDSEKDFRETKYLGGSVTGDWNKAISKSGGLNATTLRDLDEETIRTLHRLADHAGICHVRMPNGSNFYANVDVSFSDDYGNAPITTDVTLSMTRVDGEGLDGLTYEEWSE